MSAGFALIVHSEAGDVLTIEGASDRLNWTPLGTLTNTTGRVEFLDATASAAGQRFYRAYRAESPR